MTADATRGFRSSRVAIFGLVAILLVAIAGAGVGAARYAPLVVTSTGYGPGEGVVKHEAASGDGTASFVYSEGREVFWSFQILNTGRFGVTLTDVSLPTATEHILLRATAARVFIGREEAGCCDFSRGAPFRRTAIPAGRSVGVLVRAIFGDCRWFQPGSANVFTRQMISYTFLGLTRRFEIPIGPFTAEAPKACPETARTP